MQTALSLQTSDSVYQTKKKIKARKKVDNMKKQLNEAFNNVSCNEIK